MNTPLNYGPIPDERIETHWEKSCGAGTWHFVAQDTVSGYLLYSSHNGYTNPRLTQRQCDVLRNTYHAQRNDQQ